MGSDDEKKIRQVFKNADAKPPKGKRFDARRPKKLYCARCLALLSADQCPRCDLGKSNFFMYCRKCLNVHGSLQPCREWRPKNAADSD